MENHRSRLGKEARRKQIVDSALNLFVEKGYKGTTTQEIAKSAGVSEVTLFRNFDSKKDIFMEGVVPVLMETLEENLNVGEDELPEKALERFLVSRLNLISDKRKIVKLILMENQVNKDLEDIDFIQSISDLIKKGISKMGFHKSKESFIARLIMGSVLSFMFLPEQNDESVKKFVSELIKAVIYANNQEEVA
ncbi:TetR/AcrR family transcriptional regulator [Gudongella oleilytica]|jgi:AcrR family transcriptional regulator|uniref:TetR/AcrR family transcriptional regulator n=1 Tax=Gudongella oleilytica TaxID=1582259 RepID=UPI002A3705F1|nr:TetR/AcrR family transcriptional regulator [Gudongella oleilytica]MDY0257487.1 TetR/AcrR family transcriptional regulator [Gudongella oleilytica]HMM70088.1 TetR/AcrR family transcriptional regulator [Gudongella oleilytica]